MSAVDDVKARLDIADVVGEHVTLQRAGRAFKALCPFHAEKTPSFYVFPERQTWRCFGACAAGGDVFAFIMKMENLDFPEALRKLAARAGVTLPAVERQDSDVLVRANEAARELFQRVLQGPQGAAARQYLARRHLDEQTIELFQLGLAPRDGTSLTRELLAQGFTPEQLQAAGLAALREGRLRDQFFGRLMFPIRDEEGRLVGFGGRALDDAEPKYLNSARTRLFDKGHLLYALHLARAEVRRQRVAVVVEGYMDAIAAHQHGYSNVVASMGTALTEFQVAHLRGLADTVVLALDPDAAGQQATWRSLETSWRAFQRVVAGRVRGTTLYARPQGPELKVAALPPGKDPDEVLHSEPRSWERLIAQAVPLLDFVLNGLAARFDLESAQGKAQAAELVFPLIAGLPDAFQQDHYFSRLAQVLGVSEAVLEASVGRPRPPTERRTPPARATVSPFQQAQHDPLEEHLLGLLLQYPELAPLAQGIGPEHFQRPENRALFTAWRVAGTITLGDSVDSSLHGHLAYLRTYPLPPLDRRTREAALHDCVQRLEERRLRALKAEAALRFASADLEEFEHQQDEVLSVTERMRELYRSRDQGKRGEV